MAPLTIENDAETAEHDAEIIEHGAETTKTAPKELIENGAEMAKNYRLLKLQVLNAVTIVCSINPLINRSIHDHSINRSISFNQSFICSKFFEKIGPKIIEI